MISKGPGRAHGNISKRRVGESPADFRERALMESMLVSAGYDPRHAQQLQGEGMGPFELEERLKEARGLERTHGIRKSPWRRPGHAQGRARDQERKVEAISFERYRATAEDRRRYGGKTVTRFYVRYVGDREGTEVVMGYGPTPGERKTDAIRRFRAMKGESVGQTCGRAHRGQTCGEAHRKTGYS